MRLWKCCAACVFAIAALVGPLAGFGAAARNCTATTPNTGQLAPYGYEPNLIEVVFCGSRKIDASELQQFQSKYQVTLEHITSTGDGTSNIYVFRLQSGTPPDKVREVGAEDDVMTASVESLGQAAASAAPTTRALPSTTVASGSAPLPLIAGAAALGILLLSAARARRRARANAG